MSIQKNGQEIKETKCIDTVIHICVLFVKGPYSCFLQLSKKVSFKFKVFGRWKIGQGCPESIDVLQFMFPKSYSMWDIRKCAGEAKEMVNTAADFAPMCTT